MNCSNDMNNYWSLCSKFLKNLFKNLFTAHAWRDALRAEILQN